MADLVDCHTGVPNKVATESQVPPAIMWQLSGLLAWTIIELSVPLTLFISCIRIFFFFPSNECVALRSKAPHSLLFPQGGDDVMGCVHDDNGRVRIHHFYNVGQWAKEIKRNPARDEEGVFENNRVTCRFKRPLYVPREETLVDLHLSWYYLFAWGPAIQGEWSSFSIKSTLCLSCVCLSFTSS